MPPDGPSARPACERMPESTAIKMLLRPIAEATLVAGPAPQPQPTLGPRRTKTAAKYTEKLTNRPIVRDANAGRNARARRDTAMTIPRASSAAPVTDTSGTIDSGGKRPCARHSLTDTSIAESLPIPISPTNSAMTNRAQSLATRHTQDRRRTIKSPSSGATTAGRQQPRGRRRDFRRGLTTGLLRTRSPAPALGRGCCPRRLSLRPCSCRPLAHC